MTREQIIRKALRGARRKQRQNALAALDSLMSDTQLKLTEAEWEFLAEERADAALIHAKYPGVPC